MLASSGVESLRRCINRGSMVAILGDDHHIKQQSMGQEDMGRNEVVQVGCEDPKWKSRHDAEKLVMILSGMDQWHKVDVGGSRSDLRRVSPYDLKLPVAAAVLHVKAAHVMMLMRCAFLRGRH